MFRVNDGTGNSVNEYRLTVPIGADNDKPVAMAAPPTGLDEDATHTFVADNFGYTDADTDDTLASITLTGLPVLMGTTTSAGTLRLGTTTLTAANLSANATISAGDIGTLVFTPDNRSAGYTADITYTVTDSSGITASATSDPATMSIALTADNDDPTVTQAGNDLSRVDLVEGRMLSVTDIPNPTTLFEAADTGDDLAYAITTQTDDAGTTVSWLRLNATTHAFESAGTVPAASASASYSIVLTATATPSGAETATVSFTIRVFTDNIPPAAQNDAVAITEGAASATADTGGATDLFANDRGLVDFTGNEKNMQADAYDLTGYVAGDWPDDGATGVVTSGAAATGMYGNLTITVSGDSSAFAYMPRAGAIEFLKQDQEVTDAFTYRISDGQAASTDAEGTITVTITGVNDAPAALARTGALQLTEAGGTENGSNAGAGTVSGSFTSTDVDTGGAGVAPDPTTWQAGAGSAVDAQTVLTSDNGGKGTSYDGTYGTLFLKEDGSYSYDLDQDDAVTEGLDETDIGEDDTFTVRVFDGTENSPEFTLTFQVNGANDAPRIGTASGFPPTLMALDAIGGGSGVVIPDALFEDPDTSDTVASLAVTVTGLPPGVSYDGATRTISGTPAETTYGDHPITVTATDDGGATDTEMFTLTVNRGTNRDPVATADANTALENANVTAAGNVLTDGTPDSDVDVMTDGANETFEVTGYNAGDNFDGTSLTPVGMLLTNAATGSTLTIAAGGAYTYTVGTGHEQLAHDGSATEVFWYQITDSRGGTANASLTISITGENDAPTAADTTVSTAVDEEATHSFAATDFAFRDVDDVSANGADALFSVTIAALPVTAGTTTAVGALALGNAAVTVGQVIPVADIPKLVFTPVNRSAGYMVEIGYRVTDDSGTAASATSVDAGTLTLEVTGDQDGPVLTTAGTALMTSGRSVVHETALAADSLPAPATLFEAVDEGDTLAYSLPTTGVTPANPGWLSLASGAFAGMVPTRTSAAATQSYTVTLRATADSVDTDLRFTITVVLGLEAAADAVAMNESDASVSMTTGGENILGNDTGAGRTVVGYNTGATYSSTAASHTAAGPSASLDGAYGALNMATNGDFTYTPLAARAGAINGLRAGATYSDVFSYGITDGTNSSSALITVTITGENDKPTAANTSLTVDEEAPHSFAAVSNSMPGGDFSFMDVDVTSDSGPDVLASATITALPTMGALALSGTAVTVNQVIPAAQFPNLVFTPVNRSAGYEVGIGYTVTDFSGATDGNATSDPAVLTISVTGDEDDPALTTAGTTLMTAGQGLAVGGAAGDSLPNPSTLFVAVDEDDTLAYAITALTDAASADLLAAGNPWLTLGSDGAFQGTVPAVSASASYSVTLTATATPDGETTPLTFAISVTQGATPMDDAIAATENGPAVTTLAGAGAGTSLFANDDGLMDAGDTITLEGYVAGDMYDETSAITDNSAADGDYGTLAIMDDGSFTYTLDSDCGAMPGVQGDAVDTAEAGDTGCDVEMLPAAGTLMDEFTYRVDDGQTETMPADGSVVVTITGVNDAPVLVGTIANVMATEDTPGGGMVDVDVNLFSDPDAGETAALTWTLTGYDVAASMTTALPDWITLQDDRGAGNFGRISFNPTTSDHAGATLRLTATDDAGATDGITFSIIVTSVNDEPTVPDATVFTADTAVMARMLLENQAGWTYRFPDDAFDDEETDVLTYAATMGGAALPLPTASGAGTFWLRFDPATRTFSGTPDEGGTTTITLTATDDDGTPASVDIAIDFVVTDVNDAPTLVLTNADVDVDEAGVDASNLDVAGDTSATGTVALADEEDDAHATNMASVQVQSTGGQWGSAASGVSGIYGSLAIADVSGTLTWTYTLENADADTNGLDGGDAVRDAFMVRAIDSEMLTSTPVALVIMLDGANDRPVVATGYDDILVTKDQAAPTIPSGQITDPEGHTLTYTATCSSTVTGTGACGASNALPAWLEISATTGVLSGTVTDVPDALTADDPATPGNEADTFVITVTASDGNGGSVSDMFTITILDENARPDVGNDTLTMTEAAFDSATTAIGGNVVSGMASSANPSSGVTAAFMADTDAPGADGTPNNVFVTRFALGNNIATSPVTVAAGTPGTATHAMTIRNVAYEVNVSLARDGTFTVARPAAQATGTLRGGESVMFTLTYEVNDDYVNSELSPPSDDRVAPLNTGTIAVTITGENVAPAATLATTDAAVTEAGGAANGTAGDPAASGAVTATDMENGTLGSGLTVRGCSGCCLHAHHGWRRHGCGDCRRH